MSKPEVTTTAAIEIVTGAQSAQVDHVVAAVNVMLTKAHLVETAITKNHENTAIDDQVLAKIAETGSPVCHETPWARLPLWGGEISWVVETQGTEMKGVAAEVAAEVEGMARPGKTEGMIAHARGRARKG